MENILSRWRSDKFKTETWSRDPAGALENTRANLSFAGQWVPEQVMGRRWPMGCVALEITQRCNLDCSLCYLSENSEAVKDIPLIELYRRIDAIADHYGPLTDVQVTGGDPTLRDRQELIKIVSRIHERGLRASLLTNGIRLKRDLLEDLVAAGLTDVAFHVDLTQDRNGYNSEKDLNAVRLAYINRARDLPISVFFNTTVFAGNFHQMGDVVGFFVDHSDVVSLISFQLAADTGRGTEAIPARGLLTTDRLALKIERAMGTKLTFDAIRIGHKRCNSYGMALVTNKRCHDLLDDKVFIRRLMQASSKLVLDRKSKRRTLFNILSWLMAHPRLLLGTVIWILAKLQTLGPDLLAARGRANKLSVFIHNFMDACELDPERLKTCTFMVATTSGPVSMCLHNAKRDDFLFKPVKIPGDNSSGKEKAHFWHPVTGKSHARRPDVQPALPDPKVAKGRTRMQLKIR